MDRHSAKEKSGVQAKEKSTHAQAKSARLQQKGICIICGEARTGTPAKPEFLVRAARHLRALFSLPAKHTIACSNHLAEAKEKRARYEKKVRDYRIGAAAFFVLVLMGSLFFGRADIGIFAPALLGALVILLLPCFYYFPSFGK